MNMHDRSCSNGHNFIDEMLNLALTNYLEDWGSDTQEQRLGSAVTPNSNILFS